MIGSNGEGLPVRCPLCAVPMREVERRGVRIDVCPECRGVWLDGGELEKLLGLEEEAAHRPREPYDEEYLRDPHRPHRHKKKGFLRELFDFDFFD